MMSAFDPSPVLLPITSATFSILVLTASTACFELFPDKAVFSIFASVFPISLTSPCFSASVFPEIFERFASSPMMFPKVFLSMRLSLSDFPAMYFSMACSIFPTNSGLSSLPILSATEEPSFRTKVSSLDFWSGVSFSISALISLSFSASAFPCPSPSTLSVTAFTAFASILSLFA